jgi:hypothetical protein
MRAWILSAVVAVLTSMVTTPASAQATACGTNPGTLGGLRIGGLSMSFPVGTFVAESTVALAKGTETRFLIKGDKGLSLSFRRPNTPATSPPWINMEASGLQQVKGVMTEEQTPTGCRRQVVLDPSALSGATLKKVHAALPGVWGGALRVHDGTGALAAASSIRIESSRTHGLLEAVLKSGSTLTDARVLIQDGGALVVSMAARGDLRITIDLSRLVTQVTGGELVASNVPVGGVRLQTADILMTGVKGRAKELSVRAGTPGTIRLNTFAGTADALQHGVKTDFTASALEIKRIDRMEWSGLSYSATEVRVAEQGTLLAGGDFTCASCSYIRPDGATSVVGAGSFGVKEVTKTTIVATATWAKPSIAGFAALKLDSTVNTLTASMSGPKATPDMRGAYELAKLGVGRMRIDGVLKGSWNWLEQEQVVRTHVRISGNAIQLGLPPHEVVSGAVKQGDIDAALHSSQGALSSVVIPANGLNITYLPTQARLSMLAGTLSLPLEPTMLASDGPIGISPRGVDGSLPIAVSKATLASVKLKAGKDQDPALIQTKPATLTSPALRLSMKPEAEPATSFLLNAGIDLPGFVIRPPQGIAAIDVEVGGYEVSLAELSAAGFRIEWLGERIKVAMLRFMIDARSISTPLDAQGRPKTQPVLEGRFAVPPTIGETFVEILLWPDPLKTADMGLHEFVLALDNVQYRAPGVADVSNATLAFHAKTLTQSQIEATVKATAGSIKWEDALNGSGSLDLLEVAVNGPRDKPNGTLTIRVPEIALKGRSEIEIGNKSDTAVIGCGVKVEADTSGSVRSIRGVVPIVAGAPDGYITAGSVDDIKVNYAGRKDCVWDWRPDLSWSFKHPCGGTIEWGDWIRECEAKDTKKFRIPLTFSVRAIHLGAQITEVRYRVRDEVDAEGKTNRKFNRCNARLNRLYPINVPPLLAQIEPDWSDVPGWLHGIARTAYDAIAGPIFAGIAAAPLGIVSIGTFAGYPLRQDSDC